MKPTLFCTPPHYTLVVFRCSLFTLTVTPHLCVLLAVCSAAQCSPGFDSNPLLSSQDPHCVLLVIKPATFCATNIETLSQMRLEENKNPTESRLVVKQTSQTLRK